MYLDGSGRATITKTVTEKVKEKVGPRVAEQVKNVAQRAAVVEQKVKEVLSKTSAGHKE